jgi:hypothetical protein
MKYYIRWSSFFTFFFLTVTVPIPAHAQETTLVSDNLGLGSGDLTVYLNNVFELALLVGAILAVLIIASAGLQYMSTDAVSGKTTSRERIVQAVLGLLMLLGVWLFFNEIDPTILDLTINQKTTEGVGAALQKQQQSALEQEAERRVTSAQNDLSGAGPIIRGPEEETGAGRLPQYYAKIVPKQSGRVTCPTSVSSFYKPGVATGNFSTCAAGGPGAFNSDTQGCCVYNINYNALP